MHPFPAPLLTAVRRGTATLTVTSGVVASNLTNYPLYVDLANMPSGFWIATNHGKDLRAFIGATQLAVDVVWCSKSEGKGAAFIKVPTLAAASSTVIDLSWDGISDRLANTNTYGRNAVWADYHAVFMLGETGGDDRTGGGALELWGDPDCFEMIASSGATNLNSHQGVCWDGAFYYTVDTNAIRKWDASWTLVASNTNPIGDAAIGGSPTVNHLGDPDCFGGKLYIPLECYPASGGLYNAHIAVFNTSDLSFDTSFDISTQAHEASSICYCDKDGLLYISDYDANYNTLFKYNPTTGAYIGQLTLSKNCTNTQGVTWWRDYFWISQDANDETIRAAYDGTCSLGNLVGGAGGIGFGTGVTGGNYEGIGHRDDALLQLKDAAISTVEVWRPRRAAKTAQGGMWQTTPATFTAPLLGGAKSTGRGGYTTFTMGVTYAVSDKSANRAAFSYTKENTLSAGLNQRTTIAYRQSSASLGLWDSTNGWILPSPTVDPTLNQAYRVHATYQGTTARKIYVDGVLKNTSGAISNAPTADALYLLAEDSDWAETAPGVIGFAYLRPSVLSADWIAAEHSNLNAPGSFYSIT